MHPLRLVLAFVVAACGGVASSSPEDDGSVVPFDGSVAAPDGGVTRDAATDEDAETREDAIVLPVEVLGEAGTTRTVVLPATRSGDARLSLRVHALHHPDKASLRVNGGSWIPLAEGRSGLRVLGHAAAYGGIGGGFHTFWIELDAMPFIEGPNVVELRLNRIVDDSIGFRVLALRVDDDAGSLLPPGLFVQDDPREWRAPSSSPEDVAEGARLWREAELVDAEGSRIDARCADCHAREAEDLAYFAFSNLAIVARSRFHGLTEREGRQIASYVRSSPIAPPEFARPWNPPYQPGPGLDARPAEEWAAGAGIDAVLDDDAQMLPHLFGVATPDAIDTVVDPAGAINLREMPLAVQLPDWNRWLPRVHPVDLFGRRAFESGIASTTFDEVAASLPTTPDARLVDTFSRFPEAVIDYLVPGSGGNGAQWTTLSSTTLDGRRAGMSVESTKLDLARWALVRQWELVQTLGLSERALGPGAERRQWPTDRYASFHLAAHYIGDDRGTSHFRWESPVVGTYFSSVWYQLSMLLSLGRHRGNAVEPIDWAYNYQHVQLLGERSGVQEPLRFYQNLVAGLQQRYRPDARGVPSVSAEGWTMREVSPWRIDGDYRGARHLFEPLATYTPDGELERHVARAFLRAFLSVVERVPTGRWARLPTSEVGVDSFTMWYSLEPATYEPILDPSRDLASHPNLYARLGSYAAVEADAFARMIPRLRARGVECETVRRLGAWAATVWPRGSWTVSCP